MMANRDIVSEAVEQAEAMKAAAYENAKNVLVEAMSTNLQAAVAEAIDEKLDTEDVEISEEVVAEETVEEGAHDTDEMEDKDEMGHMPEMEDEDDDDDDDEEVDIDIDIDADGDDDDEEELDEVDLDEVIEIVEDEDDMDEGMHGDKEEGAHDADEGEDMDEVDMEDDEDMDEIGMKKKYESAVAEAEELRTENRRYAKALKVLRTRIEEVNLFNARLAAATDVMNQVTLTKEQKERVVEHFDSCDTLDEVTRMAGVLKEAHETHAPSKNRAQRPNVQSVISENNKTEAPSGFDRLAQLAGL
tara:strand:- start:956 stop:1861 length:906 start_codon:yes stop_codon:yes gene_type:complete